MQKETRSMKVTGCLIKYDHPLKCCGRAQKIAKGAFSQDDGKMIPLTKESSSIFPAPDNIIGHGVLHEKDEGVFIEAYLNDSEAGIKARKTINKETDMFGIQANQLVFTKENVVIKGKIVSAHLCCLVDDGAAWIDKIEDA